MGVKCGWRRAASWLLAWRASCEPRRLLPGPSAPPAGRVVFTTYDGAGSSGSIQRERRERECVCVCVCICFYLPARASRLTPLP